MENCFLKLQNQNVYHSKFSFMSVFSVFFCYRLKWRSPLNLALILQQWNTWKRFYEIILCQCQSQLYFWVCWYQHIWPKICYFSLLFSANRHNSICRNILLSLASKTYDCVSYVQCYVYFTDQNIAFKKYSTNYNWEQFIQKCHWVYYMHLDVSSFNFLVNNFEKIIKTTREKPW